MAGRASSFSVIVVSIALAVVGIAMIPLLPVKLSPSRTLPSLSISFSMPDASARVIESEVTSRLESMLARIRGVKEIQSTSSNGYGNITLGLDKHADIDVTRFEVSTVVRQAWTQFPDGVSYPTIAARQADSRASRPFMSYTLNAPASPYEIQSYAEEYIKPAIGQIKGVYKVELSGATPMEWRLEYDSDRLHALGLTPADLRQAIAEDASSQFLGIAETDGQWLRVTALTAGADNTSFRPAEIPVATPSGAIVPLDRLVTVTYAEARPTSFYRINGLNSIYCNITADDDANQLRLSEQIKEEMQRLRAKMPQGYRAILGYDATTSINEELSKIYFRSGLTFLILLAFVAIITLNLRYMLVITISLIINLAIAVILYYLCHIEIQLYSLAGITISLNLIIDNIIVMTDHITHKGNLRAFTSVLAATLTTVGALGIVFFLNEDIRLNLQDFVAVVIINLSVSLLVAIFLVPALISRIGLKVRRSRRGRRSRRFAVRFSRFYRRFIFFCRRFRVALIILLVLLFGLPVFMIPEKLEGEGRWAKIYNSTLGSKTYKETYRPWVDKILGGSLRLFVKEVASGGYFNRGEQEPEIYVYATLPNGSTISQMNELISKMESYLTGFSEIRQFQTQISSPTRASLVISFTKEAQKGYFPYRLKADIIAKAQTLGGGSWSVYGLQDQGFNNDVRESTGSYRVKMLGYNYDELEQWADTLRNMLLEHRRIKEVTINSEFQWYKDDYSEFYLDIDHSHLAKENLTIQQLFSALAPIFGRDINAGIINSPEGVERILLHSRQAMDYDVWGLMNMPISIGNRTLKLADFASVARRPTPKAIAKESQQYRLCVQYEYIGSSTQGRRILDADLEALARKLPLGYSAESDSSYGYWGRNQGTSYWLLLLVIAIIFFTTSILFNSLIQPLAIIFTIPISFIGVFLVFYFTGISFDQGGFASFILLCGITVNASIYLLNEFNSLRARHPRRSNVSLYITAWNTKILPIFLTVVSTILGFIPFMIGQGKESFWFPLAIGTIGGLLMSLIAIFIYLPIFSLRLPRRPRQPRKPRSPRTPRIRHRLPRLRLPHLRFPRLHPRS